MKKFFSGVTLGLLLIGMFTLIFTIQLVKASGTVSIRADGSVDPPTAPIQRDGDTYTLTDNIYDSIVVERNSIVIDGNEYALQGTGALESKGIELSGRENVTVQNTQIRDFHYGIYLYFSFNNSISGNNITGNAVGIRLDGSLNNRISENNLELNGMIIGPPDADYPFGHILLSGSSNNTISGNNMTDTANYGIRLQDFSDNNIISGNNMTDNRVCIGLIESSNNRMDHNNLINNFVQVNSTNSINIWDVGYPSGGNYWSDYTGMDTNDDGIGDTPYIIGVNNRDDFPLMTPWTQGPILVDATKPIAKAGPDLTVFEDTVVSFDTSSSTDNVGIISYRWDFGDGTSTVGDNPIAVHTYVDPGVYNVTLTVKDAAGNEGMDSLTIIVLTIETIREPQPVQTVAEVAVVGGTITAITVALSNFSGFGQSFNSAVLKLPLPEELKGFLKIYGKALFETVDKQKLEALRKVSFITKGELAALGVSAVVMTSVCAFVEANGLPRFLNPSVLAVVFPSTLFSVCLIHITGELFEALCAQTSRVYRQFSLWTYGLGLFLISGFLFLFPLSSPGITRYQSSQISSKTKGLIILSKRLLLLTLTLPFASLSLLGFKIAGDAGLLLTLMTVCYSLVPLKPLPGKAVFDYRKEVSLVALVLTGILFYSLTLNLLPQVTYLAVGVVSVFLAIIAVDQLRKSCKS